MREVWSARAWYVVEAWHQLTRTLGQLLRPLLVVAWCQASRTHFIEPWMRDGSPPTERTHSGCESCTWCVECRSLIGRGALEEVEIP